MSFFFHRFTITALANGQCNLFLKTILLVTFSLFGPLGYVYLILHNHNIQFAFVFLMPVDLLERKHLDPAGNTKSN